MKSDRHLRPAFPQWLLLFIGLTFLLSSLFGCARGQPSVSSNPKTTPTGSQPSTPTTARGPATNSVPPTTVSPPSTTVQPTPTTLPPGSQLKSPLPTNLPPTARPLRLPILVYHYIDTSPPLSQGPYAPQITVSTKNFDRQMSYLARNGYHTVTLEQIYAAMAGIGVLPPKPIALTFDDGGLDNYTVALPVLRRHRFVATFFVITGAVGQKGRMTWNQLRAMSRQGMAVESHTVHHRDLATLGDPQVMSELDQSRETIYQELGVVSVVLAYPSDKFDAHVAEATQKAGYLMAVTSQPGYLLDPLGRYEWPRIGIGPGLTFSGFTQILSSPTALKALETTGRTG
jgi:peptidoglycan/xylan/chitin deacetylase (PgdA/CDA1 family)